MELAHGFFGPLGAHMRAALAAIPDRDLLAAHRVFGAMIAAMSTFEAEIGIQRAKPPAAPAAAASDVG
jgi:hypothetical protein